MAKWSGPDSHPHAHTRTDAPSSLLSAPPAGALTKGGYGAEPVHCARGGQDVHGEEAPCGGGSKRKGRGVHGVRGSRKAKASRAWGPGQGRSKQGGW